MTKPLASLSLDLDDKWTYLRTHGHECWRSFPSYLPTVVPRILEFLDERELTITTFVVGRDAQRDAAREPLQALVAAGHEIGNHSFNHYPWLQSLPADEVEREVVDGELAIDEALGVRCRGFRAPGFSGSPALRGLLARRDYAYDASAFPTFLGPVARAYSALKTKRHAAGDGPRKPLFGSWRDGLAPLGAHGIDLAGGVLVEIPVTTLPILRLPFHMTYLLYLRQLAGPAWRLYLRTALALCRVRRVAPSMLLHPLDFLGCEDEPELAFFPGMKLPRAAKLHVVSDALRMISERYRMAPLAETAAACAGVRDRVRASEFLPAEPVVV